MVVEYEGLFVEGGHWLFTLAHMYWIWEDSQRHKKKAWPWLFLLALADPFSTYVNNLYRYEFLPSQGIFQYLVPFFRYDVSYFIESVWVLDTLFLWSLTLRIIDWTVTYLVIFWVYLDCQKTGQRATMWICLMRFIQIQPFPLVYFIPFAGYYGQVFILIAYILHKYGYI